jgi:hypothetical protein
MFEVIDFVRQYKQHYFFFFVPYASTINSHVMTVIFEVVGEEDYQSPANNGPLRINWTRQMDRYFIDLMLEQLHRGNKIGRTYNMQAWTWMNASFSNKFGLLCDKDVLKDRYWSLRKEYMDVTDLLNHNGFAWDEIRQKVTADDFVWEAYIKVPFFSLVMLLGLRFFPSRFFWLSLKSTEHPTVC